jgi:hypothetical protein
VSLVGFFFLDPDTCIKDRPFVPNEVQDYIVDFLHDSIRAAVRHTQLADAWKVVEYVIQIRDISVMNPLKCQAHDVLGLG